MAVAQETSVANNVSFSDNNGSSSITLTNFSIGSGSNRLCIISVLTYNIGAVAADVTSIVTSIGTFTLISNKTFHSTNLRLTIYGLINPPVVTGQSIVITLNKTCNSLHAEAKTFKNVYQAYIPTIYVFTGEVASSQSSVSSSDPDPDPAGAIVGIACTIRTSGAAALTLNPSNAQVQTATAAENGRQSSFHHILSLGAPQADGWAITNDGNIFAAVLSVEIKPDNWIPPIPTPPTCTYFRGGEIRKMVTTVSGLTHLEGQKVVVMADGVIPSPAQYTVSSGSITLNTKYAVIHVGLPYTGKLKFLPLGGDTQGVSETKKRKLYNVVLRLFESLGGSFGRDEDSVFPIIYPPNTTLQYTGDIHNTPFESSWEDIWQPVLIQDEPLPFMLLASVLTSDIEEK